MIEVFDIEQGTEEWFEARMGIPTASKFATVMAKGEGKTRRAYMLTLAGEILTGKPSESYSNDHMERGHALEPEARDFYAFKMNREPRQVGFIRNGRKGCSPDSLVDENGILEIKTKFPHLLLDLHDRDRFPPEHVAQCQGALWVCEREWIDLVAYWPGLPAWVGRLYRDDAYIATLSAEVDRFNDDLDAFVAKMRAISTPPAPWNDDVNLMMAGE